MKKRTLFLIVLNLFCGFIWGKDLKTDIDVLLQKAEASFQEALEGEESYLLSASFYSQAASNMPKPSASVYYNLGNALQLAGERAAALLAYDKALSLSPLAEDFQYNRNQLLKEMNLPLPTYDPGEIFLWGIVFVLGVYNGWAVIFLVFLLLLALNLLCFKKEYMRKVNLFLFLLVLILSVSLVSWENRSASSAVVYSENSVLRSGDNPLYELRAELPEGTGVHILETRQNWTRVRVRESGLTGWIEAQNLMDSESLVERYK
ncbi:hypothetical protein EXM22_04490 [Oceanispirochaeta crateris]|uniref:Uncharacterized protein n=1 Tax=Oceanispirochaeta crateris TaxID=2518645 RepID=A0A5C1QI85_9SPIO|nr:hypothetical protein [Oceanispirochaeta crateris]QEN07281.1 hypothetical protein EXM22_04490 [Oceanispirochaeta crateris]